MTLKTRIPALPNKSLFAMNRWFKKMYLARLLYHPDDAAETIFDIKTGLPTFTQDECLSLNQAVALMFQINGDKVYAVCLKYFYMAMKVKPNY